MLLAALCVCSWRYGMTKDVYFMEICVKNLTL